MKLGMIDLDTSHPKSWLPILREMGHDVVSAFDGGTVYPEGYAAEFAAEQKIADVARRPEEMIGKVDAVIIHSADWDLHVERARAFVEADVPVLIDKPMAGNVRDAQTLIAWAKAGKVIAGGSSLRYSPDIREKVFDAGVKPEEIHLAHTGCGVDEFNYGIHAFAQMLAICGAGVGWVRWLGAHVQDSYELTWLDGRRGIVTVGATREWLPSYATVVTGSKVVQFEADVTRIYRALLEHDLPILAREAPPANMAELLEPELAAIAGLVSKRARGERIMPAALTADHPGYDGAAFGRQYRAQRLPKYLESKR
jgi:hypothetical protein